MFCDILFPESDLGPHDLLRTCRSDGVAVRVLIRHCLGVRGVCVGVPIAFDRHMNIVLRDVTEHCVPFRTFANGGITEGKKRRKKKQKSNEGEKVQTADHVTSSSTSCDHVGVSSMYDSITSSHGHVTQNMVTRHVKQLFIRGDNIITICRHSSASS